MRYVLGIDGGQTTTTAVVVDESGCLLGIGQGGPLPRLPFNTNINPHISVNEEISGVASITNRWHRAVGDAVTTAIRMADLQNARIGLACMEQKGSEEEIELLWLSLFPETNLVQPLGARIALYTVTYGQPGVAVLASTHVSAYGINASGQEAYCGGWNGMAGDEGSASWIAARALSACCRSHDGIDPPTQLLPLVLKHLAVPDMRSLPRILGAQGLCRPDIASLAEVVSRAAAQGDPTARRILREAGKELALSASSLVQRLDLVGTEPVTVGTVGGVFRAGRTVLRPFRERIKQTAANALIMPALFPPAVGAALIALETMNVRLNEELIVNLKTTLTRITHGTSNGTANGQRSGTG